MFATTRLFDLVKLIRPYLILSMVGAVLLIPLSGVAVPCTDDGQLYYYQTAVLRHQVQDGLVFSRWLPDVALGYGLPFFNYREPLPRYLVLIPTLVGMSVPQALNLVSASLIILTGWGTYQLTKDVFEDERAGLVAGVAGMTAPYVLIDIYQRGNLPESVALALIPWVLWAFWQAAHSKRRAVSMLVAAALWTALLLSHNITVLLFTPFLFCFVLLLWWATRYQTSATLRTAPVLAFVDGLGLAAFYWLPAIFETDLVQLGRAISSENNRYDRNFLSPAEAFGPSVPHNPAWLNPSLEIPVGIVLLILGLLGLIIGWFAYKGVAQRGHIALFGGSAFLYLVMVFPITQPLWDTLPLLPFVQFPWRLIGRAALLLAPLAGVAISGTLTLIERRWPDANASWLAAILVGWASLMLLGEGLMHTYPEFCFNDPNPSITDVHQFEQERLIGLDNEASYFPAGVAPPTTSSLLADYAAQQQPQRFDPGRVPAQASVVITYRALGADITVDSPEAFEARYLVYSFPGWVVRLGDQLAVTEADDDGLVTFDVPEGQHSIQVRFQPTPFRWLTIAVSAVSLLGLLVDIYPKSEATKQKIQSQPTPQPASTSTWLVMLVVGISLLSIRLFLPEQTPSPWQQSRQPQPDVFVGAVFDGQVELIGHDRIIDRWRADDELRTETYWRRVGLMPEIDTGVAWRVVDANGFNWAQVEGGIPRGTSNPSVPTHAWTETAFATDSQLVRLQAGVPAGSYQLTATLFEQETFIPLSTTVEGTTITNYPITTVQVDWPLQPWTLEALGIQYEADIEVSDGLRLLGYNLDRETVLPGETLLMTLFWETRTQQSTYPRASINVGTGDVALSMPADQTTIPAGSRWRTQHLVQVSANSEGGSLMLALQAEEAFIELRPIDVTPVTRIFDVPPTSHPLGISFRDETTEVGLEGVNTESERGELVVSLIWSSIRSTEDDKVVFVHALDAQGQIIAQSDMKPVRGERPTFSWVAGEVVLDTHTLIVDPASVQAVRIGMYDSINGRRLLAETEDGTVSVPLQ